MLGGLRLERPGCPSSSCGSGRGGPVLEDPSDLDIADAFGLLDAARRTTRSTTWWSSAPGPAGLGAARLRGVGGAARRSCVEPEAVGGQAGTSSLIRNYPGFPTGISGNRLTFSAYHAGLGVRHAPSTSCGRRQG